MNDEFNKELYQEKCKEFEKKDIEHDLRLDKVEEQVNLLEKSDIELKAAIAANMIQSQQMSQQLFELNKSLVESTKENSKQIAELQKQSILDHAELKQQILEVANKPTQEKADNWKQLMVLIVSGIVGLLFTLFQMGVIGK